MKQGAYASWVLVHRFRDSLLPPLWDRLGNDIKIIQKHEQFVVIILIPLLSIKPFLCLWLSSTQSMPCLCSSWYARCIGKWTVYGSKPSLYQMIIWFSFKKHQNMFIKRSWLIPKYPSSFNPPHLGKLFHKFAITFPVPHEFHPFNEKISRKTHGILGFSGWCSPIFFGSWSFFFGPWVVPYVLFRYHCAQNGGASSPGRSVWSSSSAFRWNLLMIEILSRDRFLLKTTRNDREMILEIGKAWLNGQTWWNSVARPIMVL